MKRTFMTKEMKKKINSRVERLKKGEKVDDFSEFKDFG
jgi:hypothetical protein